MRELLFIILMALASSCTSLYEPPEGVPLATIEYTLVDAGGARSFQEISTIKPPTGMMRIFNDYDTCEKRTNMKSIELGHSIKHKVPANEPVTFEAVAFLTRIDLNYAVGQSVYFTFVPEENEEYIFTHNMAFNPKSFFETHGYLRQSLSDNNIPVAQRHFIRGKPNSCFKRYEQVDSSTFKALLRPINPYAEQKD